MMAGIREILIISTPLQDLPLFKSYWAMVNNSAARFSYAEQPKTWRARSKHYLLEILSTG